jgi:hypothetical protein
MHTYIHDRAIITVGDETGPCSQVYAVGYAGFSICQAMSVPAFGVMVLALHIWKLEAPEGDGRSLGPVPGWHWGNLPQQQPLCLPFEWVTKKGPLNKRWNRCSHATVGTFVGFNGEVCGAKASTISTWNPRVVPTV